MTTHGIKRVQHGDSHVSYEVHEGQTWPDSDVPRPSLEVTVYLPHDGFGGMRPAEVSWPSTSDKRPELACALATALIEAAAEARRANEEAGIDG